MSICSGKGGPDKLEYELTIDFYADIDPSVSIFVCGKLQLRSEVGITFIVWMWHEIQQNTNPS